MPNNPSASRVFSKFIYPAFTNANLPNPRVPEPLPQFSQVNTFTIQGSAKIVAITGQLAIHPDDNTKPPPKDFNEQVKMVSTSINPWAENSLNTNPFRLYQT